MTIDTGLETTIMNVCFSTRSVRIYVKSAPPEWVPCGRIESHKSRLGGEGDDGAIIEELHSKCNKLSDEIDRLREERKHLHEKLSKNYLGDIMRALNLIKDGISEKKSKMERVENGLKAIGEIVDKVKVE